MADTKITALAAITVVDPAADVLPIVDISDTSMAASGTTKKITSNQILGSGGTATLASATITGDLTVKTNVLKVDSTNNRVGIGTATPAKRCEINQSANAFITIGDGEIIRLIGDDGNTIGRVTELGFGSGPSGGTFAPVIIGAINTNVTAFGRKDIYFATRPTSADTAPVERYRIASDGVATWSNVGGVAGTAMTLNSTSNLVLRGGTSGANGVGLTFPATQVASSDANCLDDYKEAAFTPTIEGGTIAGIGTYSSQVGRYTKVGNLVTVQILIAWTAHTGTGNLSIANLPYTSSSVSGLVASATIGYVDGLALTAGNTPLAYIQNNSSKISLLQTPTGGGSVSLVPMDTAATIAINVTYMV